MANFIPLYVFISIIPIGFILIGWYSIQATREASVMGSSSKMVRLHKHLLSTGLRCRAAWGGEALLTAIGRARR